MINLQEVIKLDRIYRNGYVLSLNDEITKDGYKFEDDYGALCGGDNEGLLVEESQESLFEMSGISIVDEDSRSYTLLQGYNLYTAGKTFGKEGVSVISEHINFTDLVVTRKF